MSGGPVQPLAHQEAWELIPWYVNDTLDAGEAERLRGHLERCPLCHREVAVSRELAAGVRDAGELPSPEPGLGRVLERLDAPPPDAPPPSAPRRTAGRLLPGWWPETPAPARRALVAQLAAVLLLAVALAVVLGVGLWTAAQGEGSPAAFRTLSGPPASDAGSVPAGDRFRVRLVFSPSITEPELRRVVRADGGSLVGGPSAAGVYTAVYPPSVEPAAVLQRLRAAPLVELAEPVTRGAIRDGGGP